MRPGFRFNGNVDNKEGIAIIEINGEKLEINLDSFDDAFKLSTFIEKIYNAGEKYGMQKFVHELKSLISHIEY